MKLKEFREKEKADSNLFWRLPSGDVQNLLEEAIERLEDVEEVLSRSRDCDTYPGDAPITCGWKRDLLTIKQIMEAE